MSLQSRVQFARNAFLPRGWSPLLMSAAKLLPALQHYRAKLADGDTLLLDLRNRMCYQYFYHGELINELVTASLIRDVMKPGGTFVDVGANIGYYSRMAARIVGPSGTVLAFEPEAQNLALLKDNTQEFSCVEIHPVAVGERDGTAEFNVHASRDQSSLLPVPHSHRVTVPLRRIDGETKQLAACDFVKMDIEGYELNALKGAVEFVARTAPIVFLEFVPENSRRFGFTVQDFVQYFGQFPVHGYSLHKANTPERPLVGLDEDAQCEYLVAVPERFARLKPR